MRHEVTRDLQREVREHHLDAALGFCPLELPELSYTPLFDETLVVLMRDDHPLRAHERLTLQDLVGARVVVVGGKGAPESGYSLLVRRLFADAGVEPDYDEMRALLPPYPLDDGVTVAVNVEQDLGPRIVAVPLDPPRTCPFALICRTGSQRPLIGTFIAFALDYAASQGWTNDTARA